MDLQSPGGDVTLSPCVTKEQIGRAVGYCPELGTFTWKYRTKEYFPTQVHREAWNAKYARRRAGHHDRCSGTLRLRIEDKNYQAARLAFILMTGKPPDSRVIYRDDDRQNLMWTNLTTTKGQQREAKAPKPLRPKSAGSSATLDRFLAV
jgi:hypothetical protein